MIYIHAMRLLFPLCIAYLLIVTAYLVIARNPLQKCVRQKYIVSYVEKLVEAADYKSDDRKCTVATDEFSEDECLSSEKVIEIKTALLDAQPVYPLKPEILNTTLGICNPRRAYCF